MLLFLSINWRDVYFFFGHFYTIWKTLFHLWLLLNVAISTTNKVILSFVWVISFVVPTKTSCGKRQHRIALTSQTIKQGSLPTEQTNESRFCSRLIKTSRAIPYLSAGIKELILVHLPIYPEQVHVVSSHYSSSIRQ